MAKKLRDIIESNHEKWLKGNYRGYADAFHKTVEKLHGRAESHMGDVLTGEEDEHTIKTTFHDLALDQVHDHVKDKSLHKAYHEAIMKKAGY